MKSAAMRMIHDPYKVKMHLHTEENELKFQFAGGINNTFIVWNGVKHSTDFSRSSHWKINGSGCLQGVDTEHVVQFTDDKLIDHSEIRFNLYLIPSHNHSCKKVIQQ